MVPGFQQSGTLTASTSHPLFPQPDLHVDHFTSGKLKQVLQKPRHKKDMTNNKNARVPELHEALKNHSSFYLVSEISNSFAKALLLWRNSDALAHCSLWHHVFGSTLFFSFKGNNQIDRESVTQICRMVGMFMALQGMVVRIKTYDLVWRGVIMGNSTCCSFRWPGFDLIIHIAVYNNL